MTFSMFATVNYIWSFTSENGVCVFAPEMLPNQSFLFTELRHRQLHLMYSNTRKLKRLMSSYILSSSHHHLL